MRYIDQNGEEFSICYTAEQINSEAAKYGFLSPFFPVLLCCSTKSIKIDPKP